MRAKRNISCLFFIVLFTYGAFSQIQPSFSTFDNAPLSCQCNCDSEPYIVINEGGQVYKSVISIELAADSMEYYAQAEIVVKSVTLIFLGVIDKNNKLNVLYLEDSTPYDSDSIDALQRELLKIISQWVFNMQNIEQLEDSNMLFRGDLKCKIKL